METMEAIRAETGSYKGKTAMLVNGRPVNPYFYALTDTPGGRWSWEELPRRQLMQFTQAGVKLFQVQIWLEDIWRKGEPLNMGLVQKQLAGVAEVAPDCVIMLRLHINAPFWWNEENPRECTEYFDGESEPHDNQVGVHRYLFGDLDRRRLHSLASLKWREETARVLEEFCYRLGRTREGERLAAIQFCDGVSHEWHYWGFIEHEPDAGKAMREYFRSWLEKKYGTDQKLQQAWQDDEVTLDSAVVPGGDYRNRTKGSLFYDISRDRRILDYYKCQHESVGEDIMFFAEVIKKNWPRPVLTGTFYGYFFMMFSRQAIGGHLDLKRVLECPYIDFLSAPASYTGESRRPGGTGNSRGIAEACNLHGKLWFTEMDQETHIKEIAVAKNNSIRYCREFEHFLRQSLPEDLAVIRRNVLQAHARKSGFWYFDFGPMFNTGWWDYPDYMECIRHLRQITEEEFHKEHEDIADVLVVYDMESYYYLIPGPTPISQTSTDLLGDNLYRTGAVFENCYLWDLDKVDLDRFRVVIFANCWAVNEAQRKWISQKVKKSGRHVIWQYAAGLIDDTDEKGSVSRSNMYELTGIPEVLTMGEVYRLEQKEADVEAVFETCVEGQECVTWYSSMIRTEPEYYREIFKKAGVHLYTEDTRDVFFAGQGLYVLHSSIPGEKMLQFPDGSRYQGNIEGTGTIVVRRSRSGGWDEC